MNMYEMCKAENEVTQGEKNYNKWKRSVENMLGSSAYDEDFMYALYSDGCTPEDAVCEYFAQEGEEE
ncbi:protein of unknown function [Pseudotevenvirus RB43]|uniref:Uncharacterized protein n=2 Tax=Pseudotevenvirus RB43 TaxID=115991 RepID=Q56BM5_9CAUD|nr:hypothetical protein RB43ORF173c [Escherichia phage RB43]AAX78695.1 hypothetical protein RB43ORF173c [Escherichia phage RB43]CCK74018.1 protein of unknown function [Pseudotevenvirus RB43]CCL97635.1 protein of unknown function [Pseudotevenvirus RB43]